MGVGNRYVEIRAFVGYSDISSIGHVPSVSNVPEMSNVSFVALHLLGSTILHSTHTHQSPRSATNLHPVGQQAYRDAPQSHSRAFHFQDREKRV